MSKKEYKDWRVVAVCELNASAQEVWDLVGGFYTIHHWHPDIALSEVPKDQADEREVRRELTFPGQPHTWEQLVSMDNENMIYRYKWFKGEWGEKVKNYHAKIQVIELEIGERCLMQWSSIFSYPEDALTQFYHNGFESLVKRFGGSYKPLDKPKA